MKLKKSKSEFFKLALRKGRMEKDLRDVSREILAKYYDICHFSLRVPTMYGCVPLAGFEKGRAFSDKRGEKIAGATSVFIGPSVVNFESPSDASSKVKKKVMNYLKAFNVPERTYVTKGIKELSTESLLALAEAAQKRLEELGIPASD